MTVEKDKVVKHGDKWHKVNPDAEPDPKSRRPHVVTRCGLAAQMGTYEEPIDHDPLCDQPGCA